MGEEWSRLPDLAEVVLPVREVVLPLSLDDPQAREAVARYAAMITEAAEREVDGWAPGQEVELALPGGFNVTPRLAQALKMVPGVERVEET